MLPSLSRVPPPGDELIFVCSSRFQRFFIGVLIPREECASFGWGGDEVGLVLHIKIPRPHKTNSLRGFTKYVSHLDPTNRDLDDDWKLPPSFQTT
jgi:hypothetical protein